MQPPDHNIDQQPPISQVPVVPSPPARRSSLPRFINLPNSVAFSLLLMGVGGGLAAVTIPRLDQAFSGGSNSGPTIISFAGMAIIVVLLTAVVFGITARLKAALGWRWLSLAFAYNALIILVKFWLAPAALYQANQSTDFLTNSFGGDPNQVFYYVVTAAVIGLLYAAVFWVMNWYASPTRSLKPITIGTVVIGILIAVMAGFWALFLGSSAMQYIGFIFGTGLGIALFFSLIAAAVVALAASRRAARDEQSEVSGQELSVATFFTLGLSLILVYHFLWIIYMASLVSVWPFRTYSPK